MIVVEPGSELEKLQKNPEIYFEEVLGADSIEEYQRRILTTIADNDRVAVRACHDLGKTWTFARVVLWFMSCFPYSKVITTAPTYNQVKNILWSEIRAAYSRSKYPLGGKMNLTEWQMTPEGDWFAIGFTPRNELSGESGQGSQSSFQGFHAPYIMVMFDEATGIPYPIWTMAEGMLTSGRVKFVAIGNPTSRNSEFYKCFSSPDWAKISLNCFDSPNLIANGITTPELLNKEIDAVRCLPESEALERLKSYACPRPYLLSLKWVVSMGLPRKWGVEHPLFVSKVLGEFPTDADGTLIPLGAIEESRFRVVNHVEGERKTMGVDVARFGADATVITVLHGKQQTARKQLVKKGAGEIVGEIIAMAREEQGIDVIVVDETGVGGGVVDMLNEAKRNPDILPRSTQIRGVQFGAACIDETDKEKFVNIKARMFRLLADDIKASDGLALLNEDVYLDELPTIIYHYDSKGRMYIESKEEYKKRTGRKSPDDADSLALANFGRYDLISVGSFPKDSDTGRSFGRPFAASLTKDKLW